jgi:hypothetical protein
MHPCAESRIPINGNHRGEENPLVGAVHDRMPVMLMSEDRRYWGQSG